MLIQCFGRMNLGSCHAAQNADIPQPCDALLAVLVGGVALSLDERGFGHIAQLVVPCDALLAVLVDHVAPSLDERGFGHIAQLVVPCDALLVVLFVLLSFYQGRSSRISSQVPVSDLGE